MQFGAVGVGFNLAAVQVIKAHPLGGIIDHVEFGIFLGQEPDHLAIRSPKGLTRMIGQFAADSFRLRP